MNSMLPSISSSQASTSSSISLSPTNKTANSKNNTNSKNNRSININRNSNININTSPTKTKIKTKNNRKWNILFESIREQKWGQTIKIVKRSPILSEEEFEMPNFFYYDDGNAIGNANANANAVQVNAVQGNALHLACAHQAPFEVVQAIHTCNPKLVSQIEAQYRRTPAHIAAMQGSSQATLLYLLEAFPDASRFQDVNGRLVLHYVCCHQDAGIGIGNGNGIVNGIDMAAHVKVRVLLKLNSESALIPDHLGNLPLHHACRHSNNLQLLRLLLRAAPNSILLRTHQGSTPIACVKQRLSSLSLSNSNIDLSFSSLSSSSLSRSSSSLTPLPKHHSNANSNANSNSNANVAPPPPPPPPLAEIIGLLERFAAERMSFQ